MNASNMITLAEIRRAELLQQAEQYRLANQAAGLSGRRRSLGSDLGAAAMALGARIVAMQKRPAAATSIDLTSAASETT